MRQPTLQQRIGHLAYQSDRGREHEIGTTGKGRRCELGGDRLAQAEELDDVSDDLSVDKATAPRDHRHGARAQGAQGSSTLGILEDVDRLELDPTDREVLLNPETARSMRLPVDLDQ